MVAFSVPPDAVALPSVEVENAQQVELQFTRLPTTVAHCRVMEPFTGRLVTLRLTGVSTGPDVFDNVATAWEFGSRLALPRVVT